MAPDRAAGRPDDFERMWRDLAPIGRSAATGGYLRQPFTFAEREAMHWFVEQARARGLVVEGDEVGNLVAWWLPPSGAGVAEGPGATVDEDRAVKGIWGPVPSGVRGVVTGSHLDSVVEGGAYDGPLGVVSALAAIDLLRDGGSAPRRPIGVAVFIEEEGSRFGLACLGSRLCTGTTTWAQAQELRDRDGIFLLDAMASAGLHPGPDVVDVRWGDLSQRIECFIELHIEQGRDLVHRDAAVGVASGIWPHGRYRFAFTGEANHAGTTRMEDRRDPMLTYAMTALAANKQARLAGQRATFGRLDVLPNGTNAVPSAVTAWLDARADTDEHLATMVATVERMARERADRDGTAVEVVAESVSPTVGFDPDLARLIATQPDGPDWPLIATAAGHDAGILSAAGVPTAMLFVRNPTGISHAPAEHARMADCMAGVVTLADTLQRLTVRDGTAGAGAPGVGAADTGADRAGADRAGADRAGADRAGADGAS